MAKRFGNTKKLWLLWGVMYLLCAACSFTKAGQGDSIGVMLMLLGMAFFVPPALLIAYSVKKKRMKQLKYIRNLSAASLILTLVMIILSFATADAGMLGTVMNWILAILSVPMLCSQIWLIGIFGWACLLMTTLTYLQKDAENNKYRRHHHSKSHEK